MKYPEYRALIAPITNEYLDGKITLAQAQAAIKEVDKKLNEVTATLKIDPQLQQAIEEVNKLTVETNPILRLRKYIKSINDNLKNCSGILLETKDGWEQVDPDPKVKVSIEMPEFAKQQVVNFQALAAKVNGLEYSFS